MWEEKGNTTPNVKRLVAAAERMISSRKVAPSRTPRCHRSWESVMALPCRLSTNAGDTIATNGTESERGGKGHGGERVSGVEFPINDFVADAWPSQVRDLELL